MRLFIAQTVEGLRVVTSMHPHTINRYSADRLNHAISNYFEMERNIKYEFELIGGHWKYIMCFAMRDIQKQTIILKK